MSVTIAARADLVWSVMSDVRGWPEWTPSVRRVDVLDERPLEVGSRVRLRQPKLPPTVWRVTAYAPGESFVWQAAAPGVTTTAGHRIDRHADGRTTATLSVVQQGPLAGLMWRLIGGLTRRYVDLEAQGLKRYCETAANGTAPKTDS